MNRLSDNPIPDCIDLRPSWMRQVTMALIALVAAVVTSCQIPDGMMVPLDGEKLRFVVLAFHGCLALVFILEIWPQVTFVRLRRHDFQVRRFLSLKTFGWTECSAIRDLQPDGAALFLPRVECERGGIKEVIPAYGLSSKELAALMNRFRERALAEAVH